MGKAHQEATGVKLNQILTRINFLEGYNSHEQSSVDSCVLQRSMTKMELGRGGERQIRDS